MPITCPSCGKLPSEKNLLCTYCSKPLVAPSKCKSCGREVPASRTHCLFCGTPVAAAPKPAMPQTPVAAPPKPASQPAMVSTKPLESFKVVTSPKDTEKLSAWTLISTLGGTAGISLIAAFVSGILPFPVVFAVAGLIIIALATVAYEYLGGAKFIPHIAASVLVGCVIGAGLALAFAERPRPAITAQNYTSTQNSQPKELTLYVTEVRGCEVSAAKASGARWDSFTVSYQEKCEFCRASDSKREYLIRILNANFYSESFPLREFKCLRCQKDNKPMVEVNAHKGRVQVR